MRQIVFLLLLAFLVVPVFAVNCGNASFSNLGQGGAEDILIYTYNGSVQELQGQWNTSSPDVSIPCGDFQVVVRPSAQSRFMNPTTMLSDGFDFVETYWIQIGVLFALGGFFLFRR